MAKKLKLGVNFNSLSREEQAQWIERETKNVIKRLPVLKKTLKMYGEISDELYNLSEEEVSLAGETYARAVRGGEISTPSSQRAYQSFVRSLRKYSRTPIRTLAIETAERRLDSWLEHVKANGSLAEIQYAEELLAGMTDSQKIGFTLSQYFLDVENWSSEGFVKDTEEGEYSIQVLKLELYLQTYGDSTNNIYNKYVASDRDTTKIRGAVRGKRGRPRKVK